MLLAFCCTDSDVAVCRVANSGCSEPHSASEMRTFPLSPLPDRNGRKLVDDRDGTTRVGECNLLTAVQCHTYQSSATAARCNNSPPPKPTKTSPNSTRPEQSETNLRSARAGAIGGSSGRLREVWRVGRPLRKGSPCASKVFLPLTSCHLHPHRRRTSRLQSACARQASA